MPRAMADFLLSKLDRKRRRFPGLMHRFALAVVQAAASCAGFGAHSRDSGELARLSVPSPKLTSDCLLMARRPERCRLPKMALLRGQSAALCTLCVSRQYVGICTRIDFEAVGGNEYACVEQIDVWLRDGRRG